jgi:hypothetical protein
MTFVSKSDLHVDWCTQSAAKYAVEKWHYSKSYPIGKSVNIGVWEKGQFIGAVQFRNGSNNNMGSPYGLTHGQFCELSRVALNCHSSPVSRILSLCLRFLKKQSPNLRVVLSYADTMQGHHGGIYQATNWLYLGLTGGDTEYFIDGKWRKARNFRSSDFSKYSGIDYRALPSRKTPGKHRYLMPLDDEMRAQIAPLSQPYPKRAKRQEPEHPSGLGGSTPTGTLHLSASEAGESSDQADSGGATPTRTLQT